MSGLAVVLIATFVAWVWPRRPTQTMLLVVTSDREERTLPLVPFAESDRAALLGWAREARVAACDKRLFDIETPASLVRGLAADASAATRLTFSIPGRGREIGLGKRDALVLYIKGHGLALDVSETEKPDVRPLIVKSLSESDLGGAWFRDQAHVIDVTALLERLSHLPELRKIVILDAVHTSYDPRLGTLVNSFPSAVKEAAERLPKKNLWVIVGQGDGQVAAGLPGTGRSALVDCLVRGLAQEPKGLRSIDMDSLVKDVQQRLDALSRGGRGSFRQTLVTSFPAPGASDILRLPKSPPVKEQAKEGQGPSAVETATKVAQSVPPAAAAVTAAQQVAASPGAQALQPAGGNAPAAAPTSAGEGQSTAAAGAAAAAAPPAGGSALQSSPAQGPVAAASTSGVSAGGAPAAGPSKSELDLAWEARDRLRAGFRGGWTPAHVAPDQWRWVEELLAGFDEEELCYERSAQDRRTLAQLGRDLVLLESVFRGERATPETEQCRNVADAQRRFSNSAALRSFESRPGSSLEEANQALRVFGEAMYRAFDCVRLQGAMLTVADGGSLFRQGALDGLLSRLEELRALFSPAGLADGRVDEPRARELARVAREVERSLTGIEEDLAEYARTTATEEPSPGKLLRCRVLLHSPLLGAELRQALRRPTPKKGESAAATDASGAGASPGIASTPGLLDEPIAGNLRLYGKLLKRAAGDKKHIAAAKTVASMERLVAALANTDRKGGWSSWAAAGRQLREFADGLTETIKSDYAERMRGQPEPAAADALDLYLATLMLDGRDAGRWHSRGAPLAALAQPLGRELITDEVKLSASSSRVQLIAGEAGKDVSLTIQVQGEKLPPSVTLEMNWADDLNVTRQDGGAALRKGANEIRIAGESTVLPLKVVAKRESREGAMSAIVAKAQFGAAPPQTADIACVLPRPDEIELTIAADDDLAAAKKRTWWAYGQQGGRLNFFANRERTLNLYLTNLSSEEKKLHARLYRVPKHAAGRSGRLFDARGQLVDSAALLDVKLASPGGEAAELSGLLIAQTSDKEPMTLAASLRPVKAILTPIAPPTATASPSAAARPGDQGDDVTAGLLLVLSSADGKNHPYVKWIELQMLPPDDLLEVKEPRYGDGRLSFRIGLKDSKLMEEMGLAKQPLTVDWDARPLAQSIQSVEKKEGTISPGEGSTVELAARIPSPAEGPLFIQLAVDGDPRGLVVSLQRREEGWSVVNWKKDKPPALQITRMGITVPRGSGQAEKASLLFRPRLDWLAYPSLTASGGGGALRDSRQPVLIGVDEKSPIVRLDLDLAVDAARKYFDEGAAVQVVVEQQRRQFFAERQVNVRLGGIEGGSLRIKSAVVDWLGIELDPIEVKQDKRIDLVADVVGEKIGFSGLEVGPAVVPLVLDVTRPTVGTPVGSVSTRPPLVAGMPPQTWLTVQCSAQDGEGSGVAMVEFVVGFDTNGNDRLEEIERRPALEAQRIGEGVYWAEYQLQGEAPSERLLIEATATDNVGHVSATVRSPLVIRRKVEGGQRTTFGGKKIEPEPMPPKRNR